MQIFTPDELSACQRIYYHWDEMRHFMIDAKLNQEGSPDQWFRTLHAYRELEGNINNSISLLACLLAKKYLSQRFDVSALDIAQKAQGAPGLDIDFMSEGKQIIGEVKTTVPYKGATNDLGSAQKNAFKKDFQKLNSHMADFKFLFVTNQETYRIIHNRFADLLSGIELILLTE